MKKILTVLSLLIAPMVFFGQLVEKDKLFIELNVLNAHVNGVFPEGLSYGGGITVNYIIKDNLEASIIGFKPIPSKMFDGRYVANCDNPTGKYKKYMPIEYNLSYFPWKHKSLMPLLGKKKVSEGKSKKGFFGERKNTGIRIGATYYATSSSYNRFSAMDLVNKVDDATLTHLDITSWYSYSAYVGLSYSPTHRNYSRLYDMGDGNTVDKVLFKMYADVLYSPYTYVYYVPIGTASQETQELVGDPSLSNAFGFRAGFQIIPHAYKFQAQDRFFRKYISYNIKIEGGLRPGVKNNNLYAAATLGLILSERTSMLFSKKHRKPTLIQGDTSGRKERDPKNYKKEHDAKQSDKKGSNSDTNTKKKRKKGQKEYIKAKKKAN